MVRFQSPKIPNKNQYEEVQGEEVKEEELQYLQDHLHQLQEERGVGHVEVQKSTQNQGRILNNVWVTTEPAINLN